jgi:hypothetical protein
MPKTRDRLKFSGDKIIEHPEDLKVYFLEYVGDITSHPDNFIRAAKVL